MNYDEALDYIHDTLKFGIKAGLHNIEKLLELMGNPHKSLKYVHVAGTNGKGSTVAFISSILMQSGYKVGIYTSPYIQRFTERIKIGDTEISRDDLARITGFVREKAEELTGAGGNHPTEFEIVTAIAFQYYHESKCDVVVLEVGLGGRFDSTNIIDTPDLAVITTISYDHTERLGGTLPLIAYEKAGIIKPSVDVVIYSQGEEVEGVFEEVCGGMGARLYKTDFSSLELVEFGMDGQLFNWDGLNSLHISLLGRHQLKNAAVAVKAAQVLMEKGYNISEKTIREGLLNARWPGRLEILKRNPVILIDAAHNVEGSIVLKQALNEYFPDKRPIFIMGVSNDKDYSRMAEIVIKGSEYVITVTPNSSKALPAAELADVVGAYCKNVLVSDTIESAVRTSLGLASPDDVVCAFGSLYYIGAVRDVLGLV